MSSMFFFIHYYRYTGDTMYEDVALELWDEVEEKLQKGLPVTFESGLCFRHSIGRTTENKTLPLPERRNPFCFPCRKIYHCG